VASGACLSPVFDELARLHAAPGPLRRPWLRAAAVALCCAVAKRGGPTRPRVLPGDARIARFEILIRTHLADAWQLLDYASALRMPERHLRRLCFAATGVLAHGFVEATRMREAHRLLAYTRIQVQEVGFEVGIDDFAVFACAFRQFLGMSATDYRRRLEGDVWGTAFQRLSGYRGPNSQHGWPERPRRTNQRQHIARGEERAFRDMDEISRLNLELSDAGQINGEDGAPLARATAISAHRATVIGAQDHNALGFGAGLGQAANGGCSRGTCRRPVVGAWQHSHTVFNGSNGMKW
jgi:AraC-like DNA-binding protein